MASGYIANLSFGQQQIHTAELLQPGQTKFAIPLVVRLSGAVDPGALAAALQAVVRRHDALRASFPVIDGVPMQAVADEGRLALEIVDAGVSGDEAASPERSEQRVIVEAQALVGEPFDVAAGPLVRARLVRLAADDAALIVVFHHIVADGASLELFVRDLVAAYDRVASCGDGTLDELPLQYPDFADWERQRFAEGAAEAERSLAAWRARLAHAPASLDLPFDRRRQPMREAESAHASLIVAPQVAERLADLARTSGATEFNVYFAIFFAVLRRWSGLDDLVVTIPVSKRTRPELDELIGLLVDTVPIRAVIDADMRFPTLVGQVRDAVREAMEHRDVPFERIVEASGVERNGGQAPFRQILFGAAEALPSPLTALDGTQFSIAGESLDQTAKADLSFVYRAAADGLHLWCRYDAALFDPATIDHLLGWMARFAAAVGEAADQPVLSVPLVGEVEGRALLARFNDTGRPYERDRTAIDLFFEAAGTHPEAIAIEEGGQGRSYGEVAARVRRLATVLAEAGVKPGDVVLAVLPVSANLLEAQLAILTVGAAYAPVDPDLSLDQRDARAQLVGASLAITNSADLAAGGCATLTFAMLLEKAAAAAPHAGAALSAESPAYVMFTSGSTGQPKGVAVPHRAIVRLVRNTNFAGFGRATRAAVYSNPAFDASTLEIWAPLLNGGTALPVDRTVIMDPRALRLFLAEARVSLIWVTAGLFQQIAAVDAASFAGDRTVITGGDVVNPAAARAVLLAGRGSGLRLLDGYGPTENTTFSTTFDIARLGEDELSIPIGRPIANSTAYLLDPLGRPLPPGIVGEIWVGGDGVALGYLGDPALTESRFVPDPFSKAPDARLGARMYRTGDFGRWRDTGEIVFVGRADNQVKVRGFRVELGEISAALAIHPSVAEAIVLAPRRESGERDLVAYVTPRAGATLMPAELREHLQARLPRQLLPHAFMVLDRFPLNANGKVDTRALPSVDVAGLEHAASRLEPRTAEERLLAAIWTDLLGHEPTSVEDNFFHVGGDSILTIRLVARAYEAGLDVALKDVFEHPTIAGIASIAARRNRALAAEQAVLHPVGLLAAATDPANPCRLASVVVDRQVTAVDLGFAIQRIAERHDALRLASIEDGTTRRLAVVDFLPNVPIRFVDLAPGRFADLAPGAVSDFDGWVDEYRSRLTRGIDLAAGVTLATTLVRQADRTDATVVFAVHEAVADDRALLLLATELEAELAAGEEPSRRPVPVVSFASWLAWLAQYGGSEAVRAAAIACESARPACPPPMFRGSADLGSLRAFRTLDIATSRLVLEDMPARLGLSPLDALAVALGSALAGSIKEGSVEGSRGEDDGIALEVIDGRRLLPAGAPHAESVLANLESVLQLRCAVAGGALGRRLRDAKTTRQAVEPLGLCFRVLRETFAFPAASLGLAWLSTEHHDRTIHLHHVPAFSPSVQAALTVAVAGGRIELGWIGAEPSIEPDLLLAGIAAAIAEIVAWARDRAAPIRTPHDFPLAGLDLEAIERVVGDDPDVEDIYPLSSMQEAMLLHSLSHQGSQINFEQSCMRFAGRLDIAAFLKAWAYVFERHPVLRSVFRWRGLARPLQMVRRATRQPVEVETWPVFSAERLERRLAEDRAAGFDLEAGPLARLVLIRAGETETYLIASFHHVLVDGWCLAQLEREARAAYEAFRRAMLPTLEPVAPFRDYVAWAAGVERAEMGRFFQEMLAQPPTPRPLRGAVRGGPFATVRRLLSSAESKAISDLSRRRGLTLGTLAHLAWGLWLAARRGQDDTVFCTTVSGRPPQVAGIERMVGLFINNLPVRLRFSPESLLSDLAAEMQRQIAALQSHAHLSLLEVGEAAGVSDRAAALFDTLLVIENMPSGTSAWSGVGDLSVESIFGELKTAYSVTCVVVPGERIGLSLVLPNPDGTGHADGEAMMAEVAALLTALPGAIDKHVGDLALPAPADVLVSEAAVPDKVARGEPSRRPRDAIEAITLDIVSAVSGQELGVDDDLLAAGLTSLGLATAAARLSDRLKRPVPVTLLIEHRTVEAVALALRSGAAWDAVVPLKGGRGEPFVCVHPIAGDVSAFLDLARAMPAGRPFWALQAAGLEEGQVPLETVEALARANLAALARRNLATPRLLGGYSFGGIVAYEMARQLAARGTPPERLVIIDTPAPVGAGTSILPNDPDRAHAEWLLRMVDVRARHHGVALPVSLADLLARGANDRLAFATGRMRAAGLIPAEADTLWLERAHRTGLVLYRAFLDYRPTMDVARDLRLSLVRASTVRRGDLGESEMRLVSEPAMGWARLVDGDVAVRTVDGDHVSILVGEAVVALAAAIDGLLGACGVNKVP
jgi:amino acid adenylation domain-containing protein